LWNKFIKEKIIMGTRGREIVNMDVAELLNLLNKAFADEWLAYYQYWIGAKVAKGPMRGAVIAELEEHAGDELRHAGMLTERIMQLGGTPILKPEDWYTMTNCGYEAPQDPLVRIVLEQNIKGEQCAIDVYKRLLEITRDKDPITYHMVEEILEDEVEHEEDLQALLEDMDLMKS
jgi:bacterioferritin